MTLSAPRLPHDLPGSPNPWPSVAQVLRSKRTGTFNIGRRIATSAKLLQARAHRPTLSQAFAAAGWAAQLFDRHTGLFKTVLDQYLDERHDMAQRFHLVAQDLKHVDERLCPLRLRQLVAHGASTLWQDEALGLKVDFDVNTDSPQEGLWRLSLKRLADERRIYSLSFAMVRHRAFVGAVQGIKGEDGPEVIRQVTRTLHGVRPHFFLIEVLRQLAATWHARGLTGIDGQYQLKATRTSDDWQQVKFDYAGFWQELGGTRDDDGHWLVPLHGQRKDLADIESRKRSMYRKRYAMLDALAATVSASA